MHIIIQEQRKEQCLENVEQRNTLQWEVISQYHSRIFFYPCKRMNSISVDNGLTSDRVRGTQHVESVRIRCIYYIYTLEVFETWQIWGKKIERNASK